VSRLRTLVAKAAGFCYGVKRAIDLAEKSAGSQVYALGPLVHNPQEMQRLAARGINVVSSVEQVPVGGTVLVRAHGAPPEVYQQAKERDLLLCDATCPHVASLISKSVDFVDRGYQLLILGDISHPEVQAVLAWAGPSAIVISGSEDVQGMTFDRPVALVAQTTTKLQLRNQTVQALQARGVAVEVAKTICHATAERQQAAQELSRQVDIMVVVGGYNSANTRNLVQLCSETGTPTHHVESAAELLPDWFFAGAVVGISAGASTPDWIIKEVVTTVENMENKELEQKTEVEGTTEEKQELQAEAEANLDQAEEMREEAAENIEQSVDDMAGEMANIKTGQVVTGTVVRVTDSEVYVDIRYKSDGIIPMNELSNLPNVQPADLVSEGDQIKVVVLRLENKEGNVVLSKRRADAEEGWKQAEAAFAQGEVVTGKVVEVVKGGLIVDLFGLRAFLPASLVDMRFVPDLSVYVGQDVSVKIIEMENNRKRLVCSRKAAIEDMNAARKEATWASLEEGQVIEGTVQRLTDFGAFVDIGGVDGLVHVSEISWGRVNHPSEALSEGQQVQVKVLGVDRERERISLSMKQATPDPWTLVGDQFAVGSVVKGKVMRTVSFGAFVELMPGVEGLVHISQLANERVEKTEDVVNPGDEVDVRILSLNPADRRISLSMRDPQQPRYDRQSGDRPERSERRPRRESRSQSYREEGSVTLGDMFGQLFGKEKKEEEEQE
jgi:small subunit ribosomal protein S1